MRPHRIIVAVLAVALLLPAVVLAAKPKRSAFYDDSAKGVVIQTNGKGTIDQVVGECTASRKSHFKFFAGTLTDGKPIAVSGAGKFNYNKKVSVNTSSGGTLSATSRAEIHGQFVSASEAKGTIQLHKRGCVKFTFDAKLSK